MIKLCKGKLNFRFLEFEKEIIKLVEEKLKRKNKEILEKYGDDDGIEKERIPKFFEMFKDKNYFMLIFLKNSQEIDPFEINKMVSVQCLPG